MQILEDCGISYMFTTVDGGRSSAPFASANLGFHVGDNPSDVAYNRRRAQEKIGKPIVWMDQVHGARIAPVTGGKLGEIALDSYGFYSAGEADGMILERSQTPRSGLALAVMVADCVPVLLADVTGRRIAAIHMGRAGMEKNIVGKAIDLFIERGSRPENIAAWFGPHICGRCYEVDDDLAQRMPSAVRSLTRWGTPGIDIAYGGVLQAQQRRVRVEVSAQCTYEDANYYSHRRATHQQHSTGRFAGVISLQPGDTPVKY